MNKRYELTGDGWHGGTYPSLRAARRAAFASKASDVTIWRVEEAMVGKIPTGTAREAICQLKGGKNA